MPAAPADPGTTVRGRSSPRTGRHGGGPSVRGSRVGSARSSGRHSAARTRRQAATTPTSGGCAGWSAPIHVRASRGDRLARDFALAHAHEVAHGAHDPRIVREGVRVREVEADRRRDVPPASDHAFAHAHEVAHGAHEPRIVREGVLVREGEADWRRDVDPATDRAFVSVQPLADRDCTSSVRGSTDGRSQWPSHGIGALGGLRRAHEEDLVRWSRRTAQGRRGEPAQPRRGEP